MIIARGGRPSTRILLLGFIGLMSFFASASVKCSRLAINRSSLFICDIQERFRPAIHKFDSIAVRTAFLTRCCQELQIPIIITEQNPKALGPTVHEIKDVLDESKAKIFPKMQFSMLTPEVEDALTGNQIILCGIESHVCVLQTALDLIEKGHEVHLVCDAISSIRSADSLQPVQFGFLI